MKPIQFLLVVFIGIFSANRSSAEPIYIMNRGVYDINQMWLQWGEGGATVERMLEQDFSKYDCVKDINAPYNTLRLYDLPRLTDPATGAVYATPYYSLKWVEEKLSPLACQPIYLPQPWELLWGFSIGDVPAGYKLVSEYIVLGGHTSTPDSRHIRFLHKNGDGKTYMHIPSGSIYTTCYPDPCEMTPQQNLGFDPAQFTNHVPTVTTHGRTPPTGLFPPAPLPRQFNATAKDQDHWDTVYNLKCRWTLIEGKGSPSLLRDWTKPGPHGECAIESSKFPIQTERYVARLEVTDGDVTVSSDMLVQIACKRGEKWNRLLKKCERR